MVSHLINFYIFPRKLCQISVFSLVQKDFLMMTLTFDYCPHTKRMLVCHSLNMKVIEILKDQNREEVLVTLSTFSYLKGFQCVSLMKYPPSLFLPNLVMAYSHSTASSLPFYANFCSCCITLHFQRKALSTLFYIQELTEHL